MLLTKSVNRGTAKAAPVLPKYPLVTHNPNMLKKVTGELTGQDKKVSLPEGKSTNKWPQVSQYANANKCSWCMVHQQ